jgi:FtsZ-binding cell division protein ZapB|tara:strand:+ start:239 stop:682 length:444 start_codon:yes stop_codon:yes gene_type:complete
MKKRIIDFINLSIKEKIHLLQFELDSIKEEKNNITKSSAGDKFETSRSLMQIEYDKINNQFLILKNQLKTIESIILIGKKASLGFGSIARTKNLYYFISIGLGKYTVDNNTVYVISLSSPIGKLLNNKKIGDKILFNNKEELILDIY